MIARSHNVTGLNTLSRSAKIPVVQSGPCLAPSLPRSSSHCNPTAPRPRLGLALSSGAARGLAHIGVLQVLEEHGIHVDVIAGSSMGAYVGSIWGFGYDGREMERLARQVEGRFGLRKLMDPVFPPRQGFLSGERIKRRLQETVGDRTFEEMVRPVHVVATDLSTLERVVFHHGHVASAVHASIAIPGVCRPVNLGGRTYMDGGISDPLPVDVLRELGIEKVIAVNTIATPTFMKCCEERQREERSVLGWNRSWLSRLSDRVNYFAPGNILDIMMRAVHGAQLRVAEASCRQADLVIRPLGIDTSWIEFNKPMKYIELGRRVTLERLDEIKALVNQETESHENKHAQHPLGATVGTCG